LVKSQKRAARRPGPRKDPLTKAQIVEAALQVVEEQGAEGISMRKIASAIDVVPMSLYTHFPSKRALIEAVVERVAGDIELPDPAGLEWREGMAELARSIRRHLNAHPGAAGLVLSQPTLGPNALGLGEYSYSLMQRAGFSDQAMVDAFYCLFVFILGFIALEIPRTQATDKREFEASLEEIFAGLPTEQFPHNVRLAHPLSKIVSDEQFEAGLMLILDGIERNQNTA
jgi:TetR/AcrR family transcriptional regulator, tetracycline repressor protein